MNKGGLNCFQKDRSSFFIHDRLHTAEKSQASQGRLSIIHPVRTGQKVEHCALPLFGIGIQDVNVFFNKGTTKHTLAELQRILSPLWFSNILAYNSRVDLYVF